MGWLQIINLQCKHQFKKILKAVDYLYLTFGKSEMEHIQVQDIGKKIIDKNETDF